MSAQLETQIRRKEKEIESLNAEQDVHQHEKNHATEQYKERNENFERLRERLDQANQEIEESDKETAALRRELALMRDNAHTSGDSVGSGGGGGGGAAGGSGNNNAGGEDQSLDALGLSAKDCIEELIKEMGLVAQRLADPEGSSAGTTSSASSSSHHQDDADLALAQVSVHYERVHEFASFQLTSTYTFEQLCSDACRYWTVNKEYGTLRDAHNVMWPPHAPIARHLAQRARMDGETPTVRLVARSPTDHHHQSGSSGRNDEGSGGTTQGHRSGGGMGTANKSGRGGAAGGGAGGTGGGTGGASTSRYSDSDSDEDDDEDDSVTLIKEWRRMINEEMSPLFHLPRYAGQRSKFRSLSGNSADSKHLAEKCTTCCKLTFHLLFVILVTLCLFYRRRVVTSYDAKHSLDAALLDATYAGENFTAAPSTATFRTMKTTDEFWGWLEGPMLEVIHPQLDASSRALDVESQQYVLGSNRVMGGVRLRQYRTGSTVATGGCVGSSVELVGGTKVRDVPIVAERGCYADYSMDRQRVYVASLETEETTTTTSSSTPSYGSGDPGDEGFAFQTGSTLNARSVVTDTAYYDRSAFALELPPGRGRAQNILWKLRERKWIDASTRAVLIDFNVINLNYYTMVACTLVVDFSPGGPVVTSATTETVILSLYQFGVGSNFWFLVFGDLIIFGFVIYFALWEVLTGIILYGLTIFMQCIWNIVLVILVACQLTTFVMMIVYETTYVVEINPALPHYVQHGDLVQLYRHITNANALCLILAFLSTFRLVCFYFIFSLYLIIKLVVIIFFIFFFNNLG